MRCRRAGRPFRAFAPDAVHETATYFKRCNRLYGIVNRVLNSLIYCRVAGANDFRQQLNVLQFGHIIIIFLCSVNSGVGPH